MKDERKRKLMDLGAEILVDGLLELTVLSDMADDLVERMIAAPEENIRRFKRKLSDLKRSRRFIEWRESLRFAGRLEALLQDLKAGVRDPLTGVELVSAFYEADHETIGNCGDSSGWIGDVYRLEARELFVEYASRCSDKEKIADIILKLNRKDNYGVRHILIDCAGECLPENIIRSMIIQLRKLVEDEENEYGKRHAFRLMESLARQIRDAGLFEQIRIAVWRKLSTAAFIDIARVCLESGDARTALSWLDQIPENEAYHDYERNELSLEIYRRLGDDEKLAELLYREFRSCHSTRTLQELLDVIGNDKRDEVISKEVAQILESPGLRHSDAELLISVGKIDEAEKYLLQRAGQLNGDFCSRLISLAEAMESKD